MARRSGCLRRVLGLVLVGVVLGVAWTERDRLREQWQAWGFGAQASEPASEALAVRAERKLQALEDGTSSSAALGQAELQSLLIYRHVGLLPAYVDSPRVELDGDRLRVRASVPVDRLPRVGELGDAASFLPDTTDVELVGTLLPLGDGRVALAVDEVRAARIPLPARLVPSALRRLGRTDEAGLPEDALALPLPPGARSAYIRGDTLYFLARRSSLPGGER
ncbi:MAG: hypothetical protein WEB88_17205 [Gemmatimonadota bacterium]